MANKKWSAVASITSVALAKVWITALRDNIIASGLVQTTDTGQLDPSAITAIPTVNNAFGSMLFRFNDSLASTSPIYVRVHPYVGSWGGTTGGGVYIVVGTATDGATNFVGPLLGAYNYQTVASGSTATLNTGATTSYASHGEGHFMLAAHLNYATSSYNKACMCFVSISRTVNAAGAPTADGVIARAPLVAYDNSTTVGSPVSICRKQLLTTAVAGTSNSLLTPFVGGAAAITSGGSPQIQRSYYMSPTVIKVDPVFALYWNTAIAFEDEFDVAVDGKMRHYLAMGNNITMVADGLNSNNVGFGVLWGDM